MEQTDDRSSSESVEEPQRHFLSAQQEECSRPQEEEDIMDIPLDDPEANRAAAKIQAGFRGHMTRKKMKPEDKAEAEEVSSTGDGTQVSGEGHKDGQRSAGNPGR